MRVEFDHVQRHQSEPCGDQRLSPGQADANALKSSLTGLVQTTRVSLMILPKILRLTATFPSELNHQNGSQLEMSVNPSSLFTGAAGSFRDGQNKQFLAVPGKHCDCFVNVLTLSCHIKM